MGVPKFSWLKILRPERLNVRLYFWLVLTESLPGGPPPRPPRLPPPRLPRSPPPPEPLRPPMLRPPKVDLSESPPPCAVLLPPFSPPKPQVRLTRRLTEK